MEKTVVERDGESLLAAVIIPSGRLGTTAELCSGHDVLWEPCTSQAAAEALLFPQTQQALCTYWQ